MRRLHVGLCVSALFATLLTLRAQADEKAHWSYAGKSGPQHWGEFAAACGTGKQQSPINVVTEGAAAAKASALPAIAFDWKKSKGELFNNGHTIEVKLEPGNQIQVGDIRYDLVQFHFHAPSEHHIDGAAEPMEVHFVHQTADGKLGVVGIMMRIGSNNAPLAPVFLKLPKSTVDKYGVEVDLPSLLPEKRAYFTYEGSLTTPPCSEGVHWMLLKAPITISEPQHKAFTAIYKNNARPAQSLNTREVAVTSL